MRILLDTHALSWWLTDRKRLSKAALNTISDPTNDIVASVAIVWEMAIKVGRGRWPEAAALVDELSGSWQRTAGASSLSPAPRQRRRPDAIAPSRSVRSFVAQAQIEGLTLVTADPKVQALAKDWLW